MSAITTHVLDTARGRPAATISVTLHRQAVAGVWHQLGAGVTDAEGRVTDLLAGEPLEIGVYRITFGAEEYQRAVGGDSFYPEVSVEFRVTDPDVHYHVPLLLSSYGYSTYRGS
ncbi:MAG: hydroxyisourate hydrolase [Carbonactinosporaceae bacterium]